MGLKLTEEQLKQMPNKNSKLKVSSIVGGDSLLKEKKQNKIESKVNIKDKKEKKIKTTKISLSEENKDLIEEDITEKKKNSGVKVSDINKINRNSFCESTASEDHLSLLFTGAKLLSVNQIFAILQYRKYEIFTYKKVWHELVRNKLDELYFELRMQGKSLPYFDSSVEITLFRQASRLVDEDAMSTMFKYIIDGLKKDIKNNPNGILAEDNPKIVHRIVCYSEKGEPIIGIKVKKIEEMKQEFSAKDILKY